MTKEDLEIFRFLQKEGLSKRNVHRKIFGWTSGKILEFIEASYTELLTKPERTNSLFSFAANSNLSGAPFPCSAIECRLTKLDSLARFAAFYADQVYIANPFEKYIFDAELPIKLEREGSSKFVRTLLVGDLLGLLELQPLFDVGILKIRSSLVTLCADHLAEAKALEDKVRGKLQRVEKQLQQRYFRETQVEIMNWDEDVFLRVSGPEYLVEHGTTDFVGTLPDFLLNKYRVGQPKKLTRQEIEKSKIFSNFTRSIAEDIFDQNVHVHLSKSHYLTDREVDFDVVKSIGTPEIIETSKSLIDGLTHAIPTINNVPIDKLVELRTKEGEAFEVYRDKISSVLKQAQNLRSEEIKELVNDEVRPEIHKIERTIKNTKSLAIQSLTRDILVSAGYVTVGVFSGFLSPSAGALVTALGGYKFTTSIAEQATTLINPTDKVLENPYYFLWKAGNIQKSI